MHLLALLPRKPILMKIYVHLGFREFHCAIHTRLHHWIMMCCALTATAYPFAVRNSNRKRTELLLIATAG